MKSNQREAMHAKTPKPFTAYTAMLNSKIARMNLFLRTSEILKSIAFALLLCTLWLSANRELSHIGPYLFAVLSALLIFLQGKQSSEALQDEAVRLNLDFENPEAPTPFAQADLTADPEWQSRLKKHTAEIQTRMRRRMRRHFLSTLLLIAISVVVMLLAKPPVRAFIDEMKQAVAGLSQGATLTVLDGDAHGKNQESYALSDSLAEATLLNENLVEVRINLPSSRGTPVLELRPFSSDPAKSNPAKNEGDSTQAFQRFQMIQKPAPAAQASQLYSLTFNVSKSSDLFIPSLFGTRPAFRFNIKELPIPKVSLSANTELKDPWPDNLPLPLHIRAEGQSPLKTINLLIRSGKRESKELVNNIMSEETKLVETDHELLLEAYNDSDMSELEIVAQAVDRSIPKALVGFSEPLTIRVASAYGRYRQTLTTLKELKSKIDEGIEKNASTLDKELSAIARKGLEQSEDSPFFDGIDRMQIGKFVTATEELSEKQDFNLLAELSESLNFFLFEHEILDDRERDRDFFVAARGLSRQFERSNKASIERTTSAIKNLLEFLDERHTRWTLRVQHLDPKFHPAQAATIIAQKPFHAAIRKIDSLQKDRSTENNSKSILKLSEAVNQYKQWIEELEKKEDAARQEAESKRQEGIASTRDAMRELQKRQAKISESLDKAAQKAEEQLADDWSITRMDQNTNIEETIKVEGALRSLAPLAARRVKAALEQMEATKEQGNQKDFVTAETSSDQAGRLLIQAQNAAQQASQQQGQRGRRRRVTGDNYYGQSVFNGDIEIKRAYEVDKQYREDILNDVTSSQLHQEEEYRDYLNQYLREVVR